jgi:predicted nuclease with TOPRIM domain
MSKEITHYYPNINECSNSYQRMKTRWQILIVKYNTLVKGFEHLNHDYIMIKNRCERLESDIKTLIEMRRDVIFVNIEKERIIEQLRQQIETYENQRFKEMETITQPQTLLTYLNLYEEYKS